MADKPQEPSPEASGAGNSVTNQIHIIGSDIGNFIHGNNIYARPPENNKSSSSAVYAGDCYPEGDKPRILLISNDEWEKDPLPGYKHDVKKLKEMWKGFGYKVTDHENKECEDCLDHIKDFKQLLTGKETFCAVFILSHGDHHKEHGEIVLCKDDGERNFIPVDDILKEFDNSNIKLQNTPKLFVFQFCRGGNIPKGVPISSGGAVAAGPGNGEKLPQMSDALIMYATQPKDVAIVDDDGSWLIKDLIDVFKAHADREHVADMLTLVNRKVSGRSVPDSNKKGLGGVKCMSEIRSTFLYKLYIKSLK